MKNWDRKGEKSKRKMREKYASVIKMDCGKGIKYPSSKLREAPIKSGKEKGKDNSIIKI